MKNKIVSRIKTSAGELELSEDALCKHTIFIGSTGSGKTTSLNVLLRDIIRYNVEDETQKVGLLVFDLKGDNTFFKIRKWAEECGREDDVIDYCADSKFYFDPLGGLDSFRKIPEYVERLYVDAPPMPESKRESEIDKCANVLRTYLKAIDFNSCLNGNFLDKDTL